MKKPIHLLITSIAFTIIHNYSQVNINATVSINGFRHNWDCGNDGAGNDPDPRYKVWIGWNNVAANFVQATGGAQYAPCSGLGIYGGDEIPCTNYNPGLFTAATFYNVPATQLNVDMQSWEDDDCGSSCTSDGSCTFNSDDIRCGRLRIGDINIYADPPCTNNIYNGQFTSGDFLSMFNRCSDNNGAGYGINQLIINWSFASSPTIITQPTVIAQGGPDRTFCIGTATSMTVAVNSWNGWSLGMHYQWQENTLTTNPVPSSGCPVTGWTNIVGATSATYIPPQTPGTRLYRCLITSNCAIDFTSQTTASECVRITYHPFAAPIVSSVCGLSIAPNTAYNFCTTQEPNVNASINNTSYTWTVNPSVGVIISNPTSPCTDITFTTNATYTVTLTYGDACAAADAASTCIVNIAPAGCNTIYVDANNGNDADFGYETTPVQTVHRAFQLVTLTRNWIRIEGGTYTEPKILTLSTDLIVEGGWQNLSGIWTKNSSLNTTINFTTSDTTINATDNIIKCGFLAQLVNGWTLQDLVITTPNAAGNSSDGRGRTNYGLLIQSCTGYLVSRTSITAGNGSNGIAGAGLGASGSNGGVGGNGQNGSCDGGGGGSTGGPIGPGAGIRKGGNGGTGGAGGPECSCAGSTGGVGGSGGGGAGGDPTPGGGGAGGDPGGTGGSASGSIFTSEATPGAIGAPNYAPGVPGVDYVFGAYYIAGGIANGGDGGGGGGGAGGGGGGGQGGCWVDDGGGNGGGAGGAGGQGGQGGAGGWGAGGSFAVYVNGTTGTFTECIFLSGVAAIGGSGQTGGTGGTPGGNGGSGATTCTSEIGAGGNGSRGAVGGNGGRGRDGANGVTSPAAINGVTSNPSTSIPNPTTLTVDYYENAKGCVNSEINISRTSGGPWVLPAGATFENDINITTSSFGVASNNATLIFNPAGVYDITTSGFPYSNEIRITDGTRTLPVITVSPSVVCSGSSFSLSGSPWGTEIDFDWIIFTDSATVPSNIIASSTLQNPSFTLTVPSATTYNIRYRVKEQCCGWSTPVYSTVTVNPPVGNPSIPVGATTFCIPAGSSVYTTSAINASSYSWSVTGTGNTASGTGTSGTVNFDPAFSGTGQVCVYANGCAGPTQTFCLTFTVNPPVGTPVAPLGITSRCQGLGLDTFVTGAVGATSFIWSVTGAGNGVGGSTDTANVSWSSTFTGTAQVCVQAVGCGVSAIVCSPVDVIPSVGIPNMPVGIDSLCQNSPNEIYISSASDATDYLWSITGVGNTITNNNDSVTVDWGPTFNGAAQICVISSGCGTQGPVCLTVDITPTVGTPTTPSGVTVRCIGPGTDSYTSTATDATGYVWALAPVSAGTISPTGTVTWNPLYSGIAVVSVSATGCNGPSSPSILSVTIMGPVGTPSTPSGIATRCQGPGSDPYSTLATNATSYIWSVTPAAAGSIAGTTATENVNWDPTYFGSASVCVIAVGCDGNSSQRCFTVTINPAPAIPTITVTGLISFCDGGSSVLTSSSPTNNNWLPNNETTTSITVTQSGTYAVEVTNAFGCTSTSTNQSIVVFPNTINPSISYSDTACSSQSFNIVVSGTNIVSYLWNTGDTTAIITPTITSQTVFSITMIDNNGCNADSTFTIDIYPNPNAIDDMDTTDQNTVVITCVVINDNMSGIISIVTPSILYGPLNGIAIVVAGCIEYTPNLGYSGPDSLYYILCNNNCPTQCDTARVNIYVGFIIPGGFSPNGDGKNDVFFIQGLQNYPQATLTVINRWGDPIYRANPYTNNWDGSCNVSGNNNAGDHVTDGTYFYVFIPFPGAEPIKSSLEIRRNN